MPNEAPTTLKARSKLKEIFHRRNFQIYEEVALPNVTKYLGDQMDIPYQSDFVLIKEFALELDSKKLHGTKISINRDKWKDTNVQRDMHIPTVRLLSKDVNKQSEQEIIDEIEYQLRTCNK